MITVNSFLWRHSLEDGASFIGWLLLIVSNMLFYVNFVITVGSYFVTADDLADYLKDTTLENFTKQGENRKS
jgi:hypothetical protein